MRLRDFLKHAVILALLPFATSCGGPTSSPASLPDESLLSDAGFKTIAADTAERKRHLQGLPQNQVTAVQQTGQHFYVYPDVTRNQLYVGTPKEYGAYLALRTRNGLPDPTPQDLETARLHQTMEKQEDRMAKINTQDASIPSWAVWPVFGGLGWIP